MNIKDLRPLRHFVAVAEELHFGRAAARLYMTQPPLSQSIQALEQTLGIPLFQRTNRSVRLTPAGALWLPYVRRVLAQADQLPDIAVRLSRGEIGSLRLGFVSNTMYHQLPALIRAFAEKFPEVELVLQEATGDVQIDALLHNQMDAGLLIAPAHGEFPPKLAYTALYTEPLMIAVPQQWLDADIVNVQQDNTIDLSTIVSLPLILFPRDSSPALHDLITGYYEQLGLHATLGQRAIQMQTIIGLVSAGLGYALVPQSLQALQRDGVAYCSLAGEPPQMETGFLLHRDQAPPCAHHLIELAQHMLNHSTE